MTASVNARRGLFVASSNEASIAAVPELTSGLPDCPRSLYRERRQRKDRHAHSIAFFRFQAVDTPGAGLISGYLTKAGRTDAGGRSSRVKMLEANLC